MRISAAHSDRDQPGHNDRRGRRDHGGHCAHRVRWTVLGAALLVALCLPTVSAELAPGASCAETEVELGIVVAKGCFSRNTDDEGAEYLLSIEQEEHPLVVNGFTLEGENVRFYTGKSANGGKAVRRVTSQGSQVNVTANQVLPGAKQGSKFLWVLPRGLAFNPPDKGRMAVFETQLSLPATALGFIPILESKAPVYINEHGGGSFELHAELKSFLQFLQKGGGVGLGFEVDEHGDVEFEGIEGKIEGVPLFGLAELHELELALAVKPEISVDGTAEVVLKVPERVADKGLRIGFGASASGFKRAEIGATHLNLALGTSGLYLQKAGLTVFGQPPGFRGNAGITAGPQKRIFGRDVAAIELDGDVEMRAPDAQAKKHGFLAANAGIKLITLPVANASFRYDFGVGTTFNASIGIGFPSLTNDSSQPFYAGAQVGGWTTAQHFDFEGKGQVKILGATLVGANTILSDIGIGACVEFWWGAAGGGIRWSDGRVSGWLAWTCDLSGYRSHRAAAAALDSTAKAATPIHLPKGTRMVSIDGGDEPPMVALEHADGRCLETPPPTDEDGHEIGEHGAVLAEHDGGDSVHFLPRRAAGQWTLRSLDGSPLEIESIRSAGELPDHEVEAEIRGHGRRRTIVWSARDIPHQSLVFSEVLADGREVGLFRTRKASGRRKVELAHGPGSYGKRKLAVDVRQRFDTPRDELVADRYRVERPKPPARPRNVRAVRLLHDVLVNWRPVKGASGYRIVARDPSGLSTTRTVGGRVRRIRLDSVATLRRLEIRVFAVNRDGVEGKPGRDSLDTHRLVRRPGQALGAVLRQARRSSRRGRVVAYPECPPGGSCKFTVRALRGKRVVGSDVVHLAPDMTDRLAFRLKRAKRAKLRASLTYNDRTLTRTGCTWQFTQGMCP